MTALRAVKVHLSETFGLLSHSPKRTHAVRSYVLGYTLSIPVAQKMPLMIAAVSCAAQMILTMQI